MTERLRRALATLADREVAGDPRAVAARARGIRRRRAAAAGAAFALVAVVGAAVAVPREPGRLAQRIPSRSPSPAPVTSPPSVTVTVAGEPLGTPWPREHTPPGARMEVTVRPARTGETTEVVVRITDPDGLVIGTEIEWGDAGYAGYGTLSAAPMCPHPVPAPPRPPRPVDRVTTFRHVYRTGGPVTLRLVTGTYQGECASPPLAERLTAEVAFEVPGEDLPTNGPAAPTITYAPGGSTGLTWRLGLSLRDPDGLAAELTLVWDDGARTVHTLRRPRDRCRVDPPTGYPDTRLHVAADHTFARPGPHSVVATLRTVGCDGGSEQVVTETFSATLR